VAVSDSAAKILRRNVSLLVPFTDSPHEAFENSGNADSRLQENNQ
jgi:hypothetical protein